MNNWELNIWHLKNAVNKATWYRFLLQLIVGLSTDYSVTAKVFKILSLISMPLIVCVSTTLKCLIISISMPLIEQANDY